MTRRMKISTATANALFAGDSIEFRDACYDGGSVVCSFWLNPVDAPGVYMEVRAPKGATLDVAASGNAPVMLVIEDWKE